MKSKLLLCLIFITPFCFAQVQNNIWCFGQNAGVDFNSGSPVALPPTAIYMQEGCSTISDNSGQLLFYTNGVQVWNRNNIQMPNGFGLQGNQSTSQSALIVPMPGNPDQYYIFTVDALSAPMKYSIVDMTLQGGLGDVTAIKNVLLHPLVAEKQCAIERCDGNVWVISCEYNTNNIFADLITPSGIQPSVTSSVGMIQTGGGGPGYNSVGYLKASQQGNRLGLALRDAHTFEVFDFDVNTGIVSNPIQITNNSWSVLYGVEFSPDGTKMYGSLITSNKVYQFNLLAGNQAAITASATLVANTTAWACCLQLAPDGKIYIAQPYAQSLGGYGHTLGCIPSPNTLGVGCGYISNAVTFPIPYGPYLGLQNFMIRNTYVGNLSITGNTSVCAGQPTTLTAVGGASYQWSGGITDTTSAVTVSPSVTTTYYLHSTNGVCTFDDSITVQVDSVPVVSITGNQNICSGQTITLTASGATTYQWSGGSNAITDSVLISPSDTTTYIVTPSNGGCAGTPDSVTVNVLPTPVLAIASSGNSICTGQAVTLTASGGTNYQWSGGNTSADSIITVSPVSTTTYNLQTTNGTCSDSISVTIQVNTPPVGTITGNQNICAGQSTILTATGAASYQWSGGSTATTASIFVSPLVTTAYIVTPNNGGCMGNPDSVTVSVTPMPIAAISSTGNSICNGQSVTLTGSGGTTYQWSGGSTSTSSTITVSPATTTTYSLQALNGSCTNSASVTVIVTNIPVATVSGNQNICAGQSTTLTATGANTYQWSGGSTATTPSIFVTPTTTTTYTVTPHNGICIGNPVSVSVVVTPMPVALITMPNDSICLGQSITLTGSGGTAYQWSGGSVLTSPSITVNPTTTTTYFLQAMNGICIDNTSVTIYVSTLPVITVSGDTTICSGESTTLIASGAASYQWSGGSNANTASIIISPTTTTNYYVTTSSFCGIVSDSVRVRVTPQPLASFDYSYDVCNSQMVFSNMSGNSSVYHWNFGDGTSSTSANPNHVFQPGTYLVSLVANPNSECIDSTNQVISIAASLNQPLEVPNVFSPNNDGNNDEFKIIGLNDCKQYTLEIYNRWGKKVFETNTPVSVFWNGSNRDKKEIVDGVYFYILTTVDGDNNNSLSGTITVLR